MSAVNAIKEDRQPDYGDPKKSHDYIADFWSTYLSRKTGTDIKLDAVDVASMMVLFKICRNAYNRKYDNVLDAAAYAEFARLFSEDIDA